MRLCCENYKLIPSSNQMLSQQSLTLAFLFSPTAKVKDKAFILKTVSSPCVQVYLCCIYDENMAVSFSKVHEKVKVESKVRSKEMLGTRYLTRDDEISPAGIQETEKGSVSVLPMCLANSNSHRDWEQFQHGATGSCSKRPRGLFSECFI